MVEPEVETEESKKRLVKSEIQRLINEIRKNKPNDRTELDRRYAVLLTDLEKIEAYYTHFIL